jgi:hypothetical protein
MLPMSTKLILLILAILLLPVAICILAVRLINPQLFDHKGEEDIKDDDWWGGM